MSTTSDFAKKQIAKSKGVHQGPGNKNLSTGGSSRPKPSAPTSPLKGPDHGGV